MFTNGSSFQMGLSRIPERNLSSSAARYLVISELTSSLDGAGGPLDDLGRLVLSHAEQSQHQAGGHRCFLRCGLLQHPRAHRLQGGTEHGIGGGRAGNDVKTMPLNPISYGPADNGANSGSELRLGGHQAHEGGGRHRVSVGHSQ